MISKRMIRAAMFNIFPHLCVIIDLLADVSAGVIINILVDVSAIKVCPDVVRDVSVGVLLGVVPDVLTDVEFIVVAAATLAFEISAA